MRVALSYPGCHRRGGVERVMLECANHVAQQGHEAHAYAAAWGQPGELRPEVIRHTVNARTKPHALFPLAFRRGYQSALNQQKPPPDVLAGFGVESPDDAVTWVTSVHKSWLEISGRQRDWKGRVRQRCNPFHPVILSLERHLFGGRRYRRLIALTDQVKEDLLHHYGVPESDVTVIPNGFAPTEFNVARRLALRAEMRHLLGYSDEQKVVVFVANELERKGFGPLLRGLSTLRSRDTCLLVVGRVSPAPYQAEIDGLGLRERVRFVGSTDDAGRYYAAADVFALPTVYEAWGLVIVEALACGLPVLTSRLAGAAVAVNDGTTGLLLDDPRSISEVAAKLAILLEGRHAGPEQTAGTVAQYAWSQVLRKYEQLLINSAG